MSWDVAKIFELIGIISTINGLTLWAVKRLVDNQRAMMIETVQKVIDRNSSQDDDIVKVKNELNDFKVEVVRSYIHRDDAVIYFGRFEQKIDSIWNHLIGIQRDSIRDPNGKNSNGS